MDVRPANSDQPGHPPSLISLRWAVNEWPNTQAFFMRTADWLDWAGAQADTSLPWEYISFCWFCHEEATVDSRIPRDTKILRDIRTSTYQICRIEEKIIRLTTFNKIRNWILEVKIYWKYCGKEEKLLLRSNFPSFPQYFLPVVRFSCLGRDQIFTSR